MTSRVARRIASGTVATVMLFAVTFFGVFFIPKAVGGLLLLVAFLRGGMALLDRFAPHAYDVVLLRVLMFGQALCIGDVGVTRPRPAPSAPSISPPR